MEAEVPPEPEPALEPVASQTYDVALSIEPEPGHTGDPKVLEALRASGFAVEPIEATRKMRIDLPPLTAGSNAEASNIAMEMVRRVIPSNGYHLAEYRVVHKELEGAGTRG